MEKILYAGSFSPPTIGHTWMIERGLEICANLVVAIGVNPGKKPSFSLEKRLEMLDVVSNECWKKRKVGGPAPLVTSFENKYLVDFAKEIKADYILRGIRNIADAEYERAMRNVNADLAPSIQTIFLMPPRELAEVSSSLVMGLVGPFGWEQVVARYVHPYVLKAIKEAKNG